MWDRIRGGHPRWNGTPGDRTPGRHTGPGGNPSWRSWKTAGCCTSATLQPIANVTVPSQQGTTFPCSPPAAPTDPQTYTVTSSNPNIAASIAQGPFWNVGVSYTDPTNAANDFTGTLTYQLFSEPHAEHGQ